MSVSITVKWGHEKLHISLPDQDVKLASLRSIIAEQTGLAPSSFKLIHAGGVMKEDNAPMSAYGVRPKSVIALVGGAATDAPTSTPPSSSVSTLQSKPSTEQDSIAVIRDELERVQSRLVPALDKFLIVVDPIASTSSDSSSHPADSKPPSLGSAPNLEMEYRRLGEELLQALLRLDVLTLDGGWTAARAKRKDAIKVVQQHLSRLDDGWKKRGERLKSLS